MGAKFPPNGAHIKVWRNLPPLWHHGVYVGKGWVIHLSGSIFGKVFGIDTPTVRKDGLAEFCDGADWVVVPHSDGFIPKEAVRRAEQSLGYEDYNLLMNNCEHFASWCTTNDARSLQALGLRRAGNGRGYRVPKPKP